MVYRYDWHSGRAALHDSLVLGVKTSPRASGRRYPAGLAPSPDGRLLYVAENLADSLAVVDLATGTVVQRLATERYPYDVVVDASGTVYVSAWGGHTVSRFTLAGDGWLRDAGRHLRGSTSVVACAEPRRHATLRRVRQHGSHRGRRHEGARA